MTTRLLSRPETRPSALPPHPPGRSRMLVPVIIGIAALGLLSLLAVPAVVGTNLFFAAGAGCSGQQIGTTGQPAAGTKAKAIPADYLYWYKKVGQQYGVPWTILAGIGTVESDNGQTTLPGVHSGSNAFGAAGPMQIGIGGAAGNVWGGAPVHPASEVVSGVATDEDGGPDASVYDPADAIAWRGEVPARIPGPDRPLGRHLRLQPPAVLRAERAVLRQRLRGRQLLRRLRADALGQLSGRLHQQRQRGARDQRAEPGRGRRHRLRRAAARQAVPVGRDRAGCLRLLRPGDDGLPGRRHRPRPHVAAAVGHRDPYPRVPGAAGRPGVLRRRTVPRPCPATSDWSSAAGR